MINVSRIVDKSVLDKIDIDLLLEQLPEIDQEVFITICATRQERQEDQWKKDGVQYIRIVLDYQEVSSSSINQVAKLMRTAILDKLKDLNI